MTELDLPRTRLALHAVAELVLAGPQHRANGTIRLRVSPGGFRTWATPELAVVGTDLVMNGTAVPITGHTARELAVAVGLVAGTPEDVYSDGSGAHIDDELVVDTAAAARVADAYALGDTALRLLAPDSEPVLWPEHFDVGIRVDDINYGVSPGDGYLAEPYAYVGVDAVPANDPYWNAPFGTTQPTTSFIDATELHDFFANGQRHRRTRR
jgi:hypothetical protein